MSTGRGGDLAVRVLQIAHHGIERLEPIRLPDLPVRLHATLVVRNVSLGNRSFEADVDRGVPRHHATILLDVADRVLQHPTVHVVSDRRDVSALLGPEQIAGAADLQIAHRDPEAGPQHRVVLDRLQPTERVLGHPTFFGQQQVAVGTVPASTDPAAELVKLGEAESIRIVDEHRVRAGNVHAALDDRGADQDVRLAADEGEHDLLEFPVGHLAVADEDAGVRGELADLVREGLDVVHPVVDEEDLPFPSEFPPDRLRQAALVPGNDLRDDGPAIEGWRGEA